MAINVAKEVATLRHMTVSELRDRYHEVFGEDTNAPNKQWLIKRIAWKYEPTPKETSPNGLGDWPTRSLWRQT